jgi:hypothetical protein
LTVIVVIFCHSHTFSLSYLISSDASSDEEPESDDESVENQVEAGLGYERASCNFGQLALLLWEKRRVKLEHDYSITAWVLCVMPEVYQDACTRMNGDHRVAIERCVRRLHQLPMANTNEDIIGKSEDEIVVIFFKELKAFQKRLAPFDRVWIFNSLDAIRGKSAIWHEMHSLPFTQVLGYACRTTSKTLGIGPFERSWGDLKNIKIGKRSHMGADSVEKRTILYGSAIQQEARLRRVELEKLDAGPSGMFCDDDLK